MTRREKLGAAINGIRSDDKILRLNEADIRAQVIDPILERLGWETFDQKEVAREFRVQGGKVDYALLVDNVPTVFIEAKRPVEDLESHQDQLLNYCAKDRVSLAVLTNGLDWRFYLRSQDGNSEYHPFYKLSISRQMAKSRIPYICDDLIWFLSRERVYSGDAVSYAEDFVVQLQKDKKVEEALPGAWNELKDGPDDQLVKLIDDKLEDLCGLRAGTDRVKKFLARVGKPGGARKPADPSNPWRAASEEKDREEAAKEWEASLQRIVFTKSPNWRCPDCDDVIQLSDNGSTSTCKSCSASPSPLPLAQGSIGSKEAATVTEFDLKMKRVVILGNPGSGKTVLARHIAGLFDPDRLAIWDPMKEFREGPGVYVPHDYQDKSEFNQWLATTLPSDGMRSSRFDGVIIDHANLCFPRNMADMKRYPEIEKFVNLNRHFGLTFIAICQRPAHLLADVKEMASEIISFKFTGTNDARTLNAFAEDMGRDAMRLPPFHFLLYRDGEYERCRPIDMSEVKE